MPEESLLNRIIILEDQMRKHRHFGNDYTQKLFSGFVEDFIVSNRMAPTTTAACAALAIVEAGTNDVDYWTLDFDQTTEEHAFFEYMMPSNWDRQFINFVPIWTAAGGSAADTVAWGLKGRIYVNDDAIDQAYGTEATSLDALIATGDIHSGPKTKVTLANPGTIKLLPKVAQFKISRKTSADNLAADARLLGVILQIGIKDVDQI